MATPISDKAAKEILRIPPQSLDAEKSVLGGILLEDKAIARVLDIISPSDFYRKNHGDIFTAMIDLFDKNEPVDIVTLSDALKKRGRLEDTGGFAYLTSLVDDIPTAANIQYYAKIVKEKSILRNLITISGEITADSYEAAKGVDDILDDAESKIFKISEYKITTDYSDLKPIINESYKKFEKLYDKIEPISGIPTGFHELDKKTSGFQTSDLIIIAGRPSMGKTSLALNIARNCAVNYKVPVLVFSLEMSKEQLALRLLSSESKIDLVRLRTGTLKESWDKLGRAAGILYDAPITIDDTASLNPLEMRAKARRLKTEKDIGLIVVDYLQLMTGMGRAERRDLEISEISRSLKAMAKELNVPVVALSQLSRAVESRENKRPVLADLRESGALEQDADLIIFIYREDVYRQKKPDDEWSVEENKGVAEINIGKQRNGPTGMIKLSFLKEFACFENHTNMEEPGGVRF